MAHHEIVSKIAERIRAIRLKKNLTIRQLAQRTNVSKGLLSKIENSRTIPSLPVFVEIMNSLEISFKDFFENMEFARQHKYVLITKDELTLSTPGITPGVQYRTIITKLIPLCEMEICLITMKPGYGGDAHVFPDHAFNYLISGMCEYHFENNEFVSMNAGDSIYFNGPLQGAVSNRSDHEAVVLAINFRLAATVYP